VSAELINHLWQSSLFAVGAWLLTLSLRKNAAYLRYWLWFAASAKFLIPFSLLVTIGDLLRPYAGPDGIAILPMLSGSSTASLLASPVENFAPVGSSTAAWLYVAGFVWIVGFIALISRWSMSWFGLRRIVRSAIPVEVAAPIPVLESSTAREPGVVGIFRPILLLPAGITNHLTTPQLQAILKHELCHVRRHDNLTAAAHMLVEALFWFHPLVWWIGTRMLGERERACDEAVVRSGSDPRIYAEGILRVCRFYLGSKLPCVSGVSGADLKTRLEDIMKNDVINDLRGRKKFALGMFAFSAVAVPVFIGLMLADEARAQTSESKATASSTSSRSSVGTIELLPGNRVKLNYQEVEVRSLLKAMAEAARVNMLVSDEVTGTVTVRLEEMSWDRALDIILSARGLTKHEKDKIWFVEPASRASETAKL
jgi:beta-lactamase regulating signal transducer with metallopeptidase domain